MDQVEVYSALINFSKIINKPTTIVFQNNRKESFTIVTMIKGIEAENSQEVKILLEKRAYSSLNFPRIDSLQFYPRGHKMVTPLGSNMENWSVKLNDSEFPASVEIK